jgi:hypothetical protein
MTVRGIVKLNNGQNAVKIVTFFPWSILVPFIFLVGVFGPYYLPDLLKSINWSFPVVILVLITGIGWQIKTLRKINERILERFIEESRSE